MIDIDELESLAKAATPGPWWCFNDPHENMIEGKNCQWVLGLSQDGCPFHDGIEKTLGEYCSSGFECPVCVDVSEADLEYITAACNAVPDLIQRIRKLEAEADCLADRLACHNPNCDCGFDVKYWRNWAREKRERQASTK